MRWVNLHHIHHIQGQGGDVDFRRPRRIVLQDQGVFQALHVHGVGCGKFEFDPGQEGVVVGVGAFHGQLHCVLGDTTCPRDLQGHMDLPCGEGMHNHRRVSKLDDFCGFGGRTGFIQQRPSKAVSPVFELIRIDRGGDRHGFTHTHH